MSKAFVRESDFEIEESPIPRVAPLAPGARNSITPAGARRLQAELSILKTERAPLLSNADPDTRRQRQTLDHRIRQLETSLQSAEVISVPTPPWDQAKFGSTVTTEDQAGAISRYRIVGVDEADPAQGWVSWKSPLARALLNARVGDRVTVALPGRNLILHVNAIEYPQD